jgi:hypothetical protein
MALLLLVLALLVGLGWIYAIVAVARELAGWIRQKRQ